MKKVTQITKISYAILLAVFIFSFNSCQKENCEPSNTSESTGDVSGAKRNNCNSQLYPVQSRVCGNTYAQWSAKWWKWAMEFPITGHPFVADPSFDVSQRQSGQVWFLAAPFGTVVRNCNIPHNKSLYVGLLNAEASSLEGLGITYADQHANAKFNADHIRDLNCTLDGSPVSNINSYRFASAQFSFTAPTPWIFGATGGASTASADGYYLFFKPLCHGTHVLHYTGNFHFAIVDGDGFDFDGPIDMTYNLNVQ